MRCQGEVRRFRPILTPDEMSQAAGELLLWGYPRSITTDEWQNAAWYRWGPDCIFWLTWDGEEPKVLSLHVCVAPKSRGSMYPRRWFTGVEIIAELSGAEGIQASDCTDEGLVADYLGRMGWESHGGYWRKALSGGAAQWGSPRA